MAQYEVIIAGCGLAGLGLAYQMISSPMRGHSMLLVDRTDRETKERAGRNLCFWSNHPTRFDHLAYHTWEQVEFASSTFQQVYDIRPYQFKMIRGADYYRSIHEALGEAPRVTFQQGRVEQIADTKDRLGAQVTIDRIPHGARWVFDSTFQPAELSGGPRRYRYLKRHCKGWEIVTPSDCFDPLTATLFDFRTPQQGAMRYFAILPLNRRRALVQYTLISADLLKPHEYDRAIGEYLERVRGITDYRIAAVENGAVPLTDRPFQRRLGLCGLAIGTKGGQVKSSTGHAFLRIQADAAAIVDSLTSYGNPFHLPAVPRRYRLYDSLFLRVMQRQGDQMGTVLNQVFKKNAPQRIFRFWDEQSSLTEDLGITTPLLMVLMRGRGQTQDSASPPAPSPGRFKT